MAVPPGVSLFTFDKPVAYGSSYDVTVQSQPLLLICVVLNGTGVMAAGNVTNVSVTCAL